LTVLLAWSDVVATLKPVGRNGVAYSAIFLLACFLSRAGYAFGEPALQAIPAAFVGSPIDWKPFHATLLGHDTKAIPKITMIQMVAKKDYLIAYFLDQVPHDLNISTMPKPTRDIIIARVSLIERPVYLVGRDQSGRPSAPPKSPFLSRLKILEVFSGSAIAGETFDVTFGSFNSSGKRHFRPYTSSQASRDYVVVIYTDDDDRRHLAGFPIDEAQYLKWESEARRAK